MGDLLKETSSGDEWLPSLNGLRALSVSMVISGHLLYAHPEFKLPPPATLLLSGDLGVRIFFVISGFLITTLLLNEVDRDGFISLKHFYLRRALRLFPAQFSYIAFLFFLTFVTPLRISACRYVTAIAFVKNYGCGQWIDGHLWSLSVEEQFYLIWPIALVALRGNAVYIFASFLICLAPISRAVEYLAGSRLYAWLPSNADLLMIGCLLALYARRHRAELEKIAAWHPTAIRVIAVLLMYVPEFLGSRFLFAKFTVMLGPTLQAACAAILILSLVYNRTGLGFKVLNLHFISYIGAISYSLYIWQMPFFAKPDTFGGTREWFLAFPLDLVLCIIAGMISYHLLERPLAGLRRRLHSHKRI